MTVSKGIPFMDLITPHQELKKELSSVLSTRHRDCLVFGGPMVEDFERNFAEYCQTPYCVGVGSGTDAVRFALIAAGIKAGDVVVTVPNTFIATTEAISQAGAQIASSWTSTNGPTTWIRTGSKDIPGAWSAYVDSHTGGL